jgi:hypothetical protein
MRIILLCFTLLGFVLFSVNPVRAATTPTDPVSKPVTVMLEKIANLKLKDFKKFTGRKLTLKESIGFILLKRQIKRNPEQVSRYFLKQVVKKAGKNADNSSKGQTAFIFGLVGAGLLILGLFVPYIILAALAAAILAIVLGYIAKKENPGDKKAGAATLLGWITIGLFLAILLIAVIALASSDWW